MGLAFGCRKTKVILMKKNKQFENMTFEEIYSFMNSNLTNNITNVLKYCVTAGCL